MPVKMVQIVTRSDNVGGAQMHLLDLSVELCRRGHEVYILFGGNGPFVQQILEKGIPFQPLDHLVRPIHPFKDAMAFFEIRRHLKYLNPDLVALHTSKAGWLGRAASWSLGIPSVFTVHGWSFIQTASPVRAKFYILAEKIASLMASRVITVSRHDLYFCISHKLLPPNKAVTVYNGIPDIAYSQPEQEVVVPTLIMVARMEKPKNHFLLLEAIESLKDLPWQLNLVGDGPLRHEIQRLVSRLELTGRVHLLGARRDVPELLSRAQVFVLSSDMEGLPISILEAMRAGLPVVATNVGGVAEAVEDGINGFLVSKGHMGQMVEALRVLIADHELRRRMGAASREKYEKMFQLEDMVTKTLRVYSETVAKRVGDQE